MIEPARSYGEIHLGGIPDQIVFSLQHCPASKILVTARKGSLPKLRLITLLAVFPDFFCVPEPSGHHAPLLLSGVSGFVAAPADIGAANGDTGFRLQTSDYLIVPLPVVALHVSIRPLATGAVKPDTEYIAVSCQQLRQLSHKKIVVLRSFSIAWFVTVPGR